VSTAVTSKRRNTGSRWERSVTAAVLVAAVTGLGYLGWLGWDQHKERIPGTSSYHGPYQSWQVVGLAATLGLLAIGAAWRGVGRVAIATIPLVLTVAWSYNAATAQTSGANLWPVGAVVLALGSLLATVFTVALTAGVRRFVSR
jgi:predicted anti-sigma-YlaC factor YlaD